jgi:hypothetical protein
MTVEINLPNRPDETEHTVVGDYIVFAGIDYDSDTDNPCENWDGFGSIRSLSSSHINNISGEEAVELLQNDVDVVALSYYEHGQSLWFVKDTSAPAGVEFQWDGVRFAGIWIPGDAVRESYTGQNGLTRREWMVKQAECACETYTQWVNGDAYGYTVTAYKVRKDDDGEVFDQLDDYRRDAEIFEDSCWGFFGWDTVLEEVKGATKNAVETIEEL